MFPRSESLKLLVPSWMITDNRSTVAHSLIAAYEIVQKMNQIRELR